MKNNSKTIIITGATGLVGKNLIKKIVLFFPKNEILCLIKDGSDAKPEKSGRTLLKTIGLEVKVVDLTNKATLTNLPKNPKLVIHLAAETDTAKKNHQVNFEGVKNLYTSLGKLEAKTHFIHISTMALVSGRPDCLFPISESSKDYPTNEYTRTKLKGERFLIKKCQRDKFALTILRPNTIYGQGYRENSLFDKVKKGVENNSLSVKINWPGKSALIHVDDVVNAILFFSKKKPVRGIPEKYLLYAENLSIAEISKIIHKRLKIKYKAINCPSFFWKVIAPLRLVFPFFEKIMTPGLYNNLWRLSLIIDDAVWCQTDKLTKVYPKWNPKKLSESIKNIM